MNIPTRTGPRKKVTLNMTSMIDVIFLLLIFFVCTANFKPPEEKLPMNLNRAGSMSEIVSEDPDESDFDFVLVRLGIEDGRLRWLVRERRCAALSEVESVLRELASIKSDIPVLLDPEDDVPAEHIVHMYDICRRVGLTRFHLVGEE